MAGFGDKDAVVLNLRALLQEDKASMQMQDFAILALHNTIAQGT